MGARGPLARNSFVNPKLYNPKHFKQVLKKVNWFLPYISKIGQTRLFHLNPEILARRGHNSFTISEGRNLMRTGQEGPALLNQNSESSLSSIRFQP